MMGHRLSALLLLLLSCPGLTRAAGEEQALAGYSAESSRTEAEWERKFRALPSAAAERDAMQRLSARPHHVGSPYDADNARWLLSKMKEWGWQADIESFDVLFPTPKQRLVELVEPSRFTASLAEPPIAIDPTSGQTAEQLPTYNAYSIDGDVTAPLVYVNYGVPDDYEKLDRLGISVRGAMVIARYGGSWRGVKPKVAAEHGAVGCLIYSDPRDDGYFEDDVFPLGPMRNPHGVQRGSVMDMALYPGDPLTPDVGSVAGAMRLSLQEAKTLTKIPVLPLSYGDALPLLSALKGPVAPGAWRGALAITYHIGPGPAKVHLRVTSNWDTKTIRDVVAKIPGASDPDEWIVRGNHHDAWVNGAQDPLSGTAALLEEARALGELLRQGWKPKRTIVYCLWDGEEPGLLGSTEWAETHAEELRRHAAVYINSDSNDRGFLLAQGSHSLEHVLNAVANEVEDPEKKISVWKRWQAKEIVDAESPEKRREARERADLRIRALGSGSDYTVFLDHLGIASLNLGFVDEDLGGIYHSVYDDFYWYTHFSDTDFSYGRALSEVAGTAVMRLADADLLPFEFKDFADTVHRYADELQKLLKDKQDEAVERNQELDEGALAARADPKQPYAPPVREPIPPHLNFAPLLNASDLLTRNAARYAQALAKLGPDGINLAPEKLARLNAGLISSERKLTNSEGLPGRPWFQHLIYAPGMYTGYAVKTLPGVREAIEQKHWKEAEMEIARLSRALEDEAGLLDSLAAELEQP